jgi:hypothetical protein
MSQYIIIPTEDEIFKPVTYPSIKPNMYEVSNYGAVRRIGNTFNVNQYYDRDGYLRVSLQSTKLDKFGHKRSINMLAHRLVLWEFVGPPPSEDKNLCNHKNSIRDFNYYENLEWATPKENTHHGETYGRITHPKTFLGSRKYDQDMVDRYLRMIVDGYTNTEILNHFNLEGHDRTKIRFLLRDIRQGKSHTEDIEKVRKNIV